MTDITFCDIFDLYLKAFISDAAFWALITIGALSMMCLIHMKKKGGKR